jgi:hypothetical protein
MRRRKRALNLIRNLPLPFEGYAYLTYITINNYIKGHHDIFKMVTSLRPPFIEKYAI